MTTFFFMIRGGRIQLPLKRAFRWRADDGPILNVGLVALRFFRESDLYC